MVSHLLLKPNDTVYKSSIPTITSDYDAPQEIIFYHDIDNSEPVVWTEKNSVRLHNINTGNAIVSLPQISKETIEKLKKVNYDGRLYRLKSVVRTSKGKENVFYSFMKMDSFIKSGFLTSTVVNLDQSGSVICVKVYPKKTDRVTKLMGYNSTITFKGSEQGPLPDLTSYILKLEREREAKEKGATQDNRSFLAKYWMFIVPVLMFAILSGTNGEAASQQQNR